jgi:hypothetical protein
LLLESEPTAIKGVRKLLNGEEADQETALMIIDTVAQRDHGIVSAFGSELEELNESPSMALRLVARRLTGKDGIQAEHQPSEQSLPAIYQLTFPPANEVEDVWANNERTAFDFLPETEDPYQLLKIKLHEINWAASDAGLPEANVIQRSAQIFRQLAENDRWSRLGEKWLRGRLNSAGLEYPYRRPRSMVARRAFFHLVAELVDYGFLDASHIHSMKPVLDYYDPELFFIEPSRTPGFTYQMARETSAPFADSKQEDFPKLVTEDDLIILGEFSRVKRLEWELPTVVTQTMVAPAGLKPSTDPERFLPREIFWMVKDYPDLVSDYSPTPIIIWEEGGMRMFDSPNSGWLAFNPTLTRELGWTTRSDHSFGWSNSSGELAVWSIYWKDGIYETRPPRLYETVARGWAVVGTRKALKQIQEQFGIPLAQYQRIEQSSLRDHERKVRVHYAEVDLSHI